MNTGNNNFSSVDVSEQNARWEALEISLPGFDLRNVKTLIGGDANLYVRMLSQFHAEYLEEGINIVFTLGIDKRSVAERMLHKLKGISGNLGAMALNQVCEHLDAQLKNGRYTEKEFDQWRFVLQKTIDDVGMLLERYPPQIHNQGQETSDLELKAILAELDGILAEDRYVDDALLDRMKSHIKPSEQRLHDTLVKHIASVDYPKARSTLKTLIYLSNAAG
jgi:HPt (histidine-containing phosphotransfer) domain-containing protein